MNKKSIIFLSFILSLVCVVSAFLTAESLGVKRDAKRNVENFQQIVHGLGLGASTKPTWCYINFDPRIDPRCTCIEWPIPGGYCFCPDHTGTVSHIAGNLNMGVSIEIIGR